MTSLERADSSPWYVRIGYIAVIVAIAATGVFWAALTPPAQSVDEPVHVNSVIRLMQGGGWPAPQSAPVLEATAVATIEAGRPWMDRTWDDQLELDTLPAAEDRSVVGGMDQPITRDGKPMIDWMTQHPPTWYAIAAVAMNVAGADEWRWDQLYFGIRMVSITFVTAAAGFVLAGIRRLTGSPAAAMIGTLAIFTSAQFFNVLSMATNDSLAVFAGAGLLFFLIRALTSRDGIWRSRWLDTLGAAGFLGLGLLTKGTLLTAIPVVFLALLIAGIRGGGGWIRRLLPAAVSMAVAFAIGGWYYFRNILVYGEIQSSNSGTGRAAEAFDDYSLPYYLSTAATRVASSFWESTRPYLMLPGWLLAALLILTVVATVIVFVRSPQRLTIAVLAVYPLCVVGLLVFHGWEVYWNNGRLVGLQGRYLFPAIVIYGGVIALAWLATFGRARRGAVRAVSAAVLSLGLLAVGVVGIAVDFRYRWMRDGESFGEAWTAMAESGAATPVAIGVFAAVATLAGLIAVVAATTAAGRVRSGQDQEPRRTVDSSESQRADV